jgi:hypothetical protein
MLLLPLLWSCPLLCSAGAWRGWQGCFNTPSYHGFFLLLTCCCLCCCVVFCCAALEHGVAGKAADVYSFGVLLWQVGWVLLVK